MVEKETTKLLRGEDAVSTKNDAIPVIIHGSIDTSAAQRLSTPEEMRKLSEAVQGRSATPIKGKFNLLNFIFRRKK